jgi:hypothetical protein
MLTASFRLSGRAMRRRFAREGKSAVKGFMTILAS